MINPVWVRAMAAYNSEMNRRLYAAADGLDDAARRALYLDAWRHVMTRHNVLVMGHQRSLIGVRAEVRDFEPGFTVSPHRVDGGVARTWLAR